MKISRRDTIIIAVLVNVALLAALFATANRTDDKSCIAARELPIENSLPSPKSEIKVARAALQEEKKLPVDEIDQVLQEYALKQKVVQKEVVADEPKKKLAYVDVTVKKGDVLEKIAKTHGAKVEEIMSVNELNSANLKIGQHLKVPRKATRKAVKEPKEEIKGVEYYVVKSGDSPWKIAKKFQVKYEDLLTLNELDEESAKNLKIGQKIRIR
jgi:LysM repeat protein